MTEADRMLLVEAWDRLDNAAQNVTTALPSKLTQAVAALDHERLAMRSVIQSILRTASSDTRRSA